MASGYRVLPPVYDRWQQTYGSDFTALILPRVLSTIRQFRIPVSSMLDLACGTGSLAIAMAQRGWTVCGVDASEGMIRVASDKLSRTQYRDDVLFIRQDMRSLRLPDPVGLVTSMFDSINHLLSPRDLLRTFRGVHAALVPGGYFIFDTNNERCYRTVWRQTQTVDHRDFTLILRNSYDRERRRAMVRLTLFEREGSVHTRSDETVRERCYANAEIRNALRRAGFEILRCEDFNFTADADVGKIKTWWVVQRPAHPARLSR